MIDRSHKVVQLFKDLGLGGKNHYCSLYQYSPHKDTACCLSVFSTISCSILIHLLCYNNAIINEAFPHIGCDTDVMILNIAIIVRSSDIYHTYMIHIVWITKVPTRPCVPMYVGSVVLERDFFNGVLC